MDERLQQLTNNRADFAYSAAGILMKYAKKCLPSPDAEEFAVEIDKLVKKHVTRMDEITGD